MVKWPGEDNYHLDKQYDDEEDDEEDAGAVHGFTEEEMIFDNERNEFASEHAAFRNRFRRKRIRAIKQQRFRDKQADEKTFDDFDLDFHEQFFV